MGGKLRWGPVHSEAFWVEHAKAAEKDDFALVRRLVEVLSEATGDVEALAVASYDLGEIAHRHAGAKSALVKLGAKASASTSPVASERTSTRRRTRAKSSRKRPAPRRRRSLPRGL